MSSKPVTTSEPLSHLVACRVRAGALYLYVDSVTRSELSARHPQLLFFEDIEESTCDEDLVRAVRKSAPHVPFHLLADWLDRTLRRFAEEHGAL